MLGKKLHRHFSWMFLYVHDLTLNALYLGTIHLKAKFNLSLVGLFTLQSVKWDFHHRLGVNICWLNIWRLPDLPTLILKSQKLTKTGLWLPTEQLTCNVCMRLECVQESVWDASGMCVRPVQNAHETYPCKRKPHNKAAAWLN